MALHVLPEGVRATTDDVVVAAGAGGAVYVTDVVLVVVNVVVDIFTDPTGTTPWLFGGSAEVAGYERVCTPRGGTLPFGGLATGGSEGVVEAMMEPVGTVVMIIGEIAPLRVNRGVHEVVTRHVAQSKLIA